MYGLILAGGSGTRMGKTDLPKQFLSLGGRPIIVHTIEQFLISPLKILTLLHENNKNNKTTIVRKNFFIYLSNFSNLSIILPTSGCLTTSKFSNSITPTSGKSFNIELAIFNPERLEEGKCQFKIDFYCDIISTDSIHCLKCLMLCPRKIRIIFCF